MHRATPEQIHKLNKMISTAKVAMLTTAHDDGSLHSRPMVAVDDLTDGVIRFFTSAFSPKVGEVRSDHEASVTFSAPEENQYISISGVARVSHDRARMDELWDPELHTWFPQGLKEPELALLEVEIRELEYWDQPSSRMINLYGLANALISGRTGTPEDHDEVSFG